jgi:hypothetical protein
LGRTADVVQGGGGLFARLPVVAAEEGNEALDCPRESGVEVLEDHQGQALHTARRGSAPNWQDAIQFGWIEAVNGGGLPAAEGAGGECIGDQAEVGRIELEIHETFAPGRLEIGSAVGQRQVRPVGTAEENQVWKDPAWRRP